MFKFFQSIWSFFEIIWEFITNLITGLVNAFTIVSSSIAIPVQLLIYVPSFIWTSIIVVISIGVIKLIIGWGNS